MNRPQCGKPWVVAPVIALAGLLVAGTMAGWHSGHTAYAHAADSSIEYAENGTAPVASFNATDQDEDAIRWNLSGPDSERFTISDGGVLAFRAPPDYENPRTRASGGPPGERNVYRVTITVAGGTHNVEVTVTDVDEEGVARIDRPQPQVSRPLGASLSDEDDGVTDERWQWERSGDGTTWTAIRGATSQRRSPDPDDVGMYLRATVTYSDKFGSGKTASAVSDNRVEARTLANAAPSFAGQDEDDSTSQIEVSRSVAENTEVGRTVGRTVSATDADDDILFYELLDTPDMEDDRGRARFTIDGLSGQIRVGKVLGADSCDGQDDTGEHEDENSTTLSGVPTLPGGEDPRAQGDGRYVLRVRASDPSTAAATVTVIVTVTDVNEPPRFVESAPTVVRVRENAEPEDIGAIVDPGTFAVIDQDCVDKPGLPFDPRDPPIVYSLRGDDLEKLHFIPVDESDYSRGFTLGRPLDYEEQSSYLITVVAGSGKGLRRLSASLDVTVEVVNDEDLGKVLLSQREPQVGKAVHASVSDEDGGVRVSEWSWERSEEITVDGEGTPSAVCRDDSGTSAISVVGGWTEIVGAASAAYTARPGDVGRCLRATATYTDSLENPAGAADEQAAGATEAPVQASNPANTAPHFVGDSDGTSRRVDENTAPGQDIGAPVTAHDDDGDLLVYTLGGPDAASFDISGNNGQLKTKSALDHEAKGRYSVEVVATDPSGASAAITVSIRVNDEDEPAQIVAKRFTSFAENASGEVGRFEATDEDEDAIIWLLSGRDADLFSIDGGVLYFRQPPDYERPRSALEGASLEERNVYRLTVEASGGAQDVQVTVTDVDETGTVRVDRPQPQAERPLGVTLFDEDGGVTAEGWQWARSRDGSTWTDIRGATSAMRSPLPDDVGMYLRATVTYSDRFGSGKRASGVSANRVEARTLANTAPSFAGLDGDKETAYVEVSRSVRENTPAGAPIGDPVTAADADEDTLFYELLDTPDLADEDGNVRFTIDSLSGQIRMGEELGADGEQRVDEDSTSLTGGPALPDDDDADDASNSEYVLRVRAIDPSTASDTVNVIVRVTEVNEPPAFADGVPTLLRVRENEDPPVLTLEDGAREVNDGAFAVTDEDGIVSGEDGYDDTDYSYTVTGEDDDLFEVDDMGTLSFRAGREPDFEEQSSYAITIEASSGEGERKLTARLDVTINVIDTEDEGEVELSHRQPHVGIDLQATASDPDGGVSIISWQWERSELVAVDANGEPTEECEGDRDGTDVVGGWGPIGGALSDVYAPRVEDLGRCIRARVTYTDSLGEQLHQAVGSLEVPVERLQVHGVGPIPTVNAAPVFPDQDFLTEGDQSDSTSRSVPENTESRQSIGNPVTATDADGDLLVYTLGGPDARHFRIARNTGQLTTRSELNFEERNVYTVVVTATDGIGASDSIRVTINVTDEDDPAVIRLRE